jgi:hypothetical protein
MGVAGGVVRALVAFLVGALLLTVLLTAATAAVLAYNRFAGYVNSHNRLRGALNTLLALVAAALFVYGAYLLGQRVMGILS